MIVKNICRLISFNPVGVHLLCYPVKLLLFVYYKRESNIRKNNAFHTHHHVNSCRSISLIKKKPN